MSINDKPEVRPPLAKGDYQEMLRGWGIDPKSAEERAEEAYGDQARAEAGPPFDYQSEEVGEAFTEWCAGAQVEARDDQEYRRLRHAFTAGMNETSRYAGLEPEAGS